MRAGRYWMRLSRFLMIAASWLGVPQEPRLPRLFFMFGQAPSAGLRSGAIAQIGQRSLSLRRGVVRSGNNG